MPTLANRCSINYSNDSVLSPSYSYPQPWVEEEIKEEKRHVNE